LSAGEHRQLTTIKVDRMPTESGDLAAANAAQGRKYQGNKYSLLARRVEHRGRGRSVDRGDRLALDFRTVPLFQKSGRIAGNELPPLGLAQRGIKNSMHVVNSARA